MLKNKNLIKFGQRLRQKRKLKKLTQAKLAEKINVSTNFIGMVERGERNTTIDKLFLICESLDISISEFFKDI